MKNFLFLISLSLCFAACNDEENFGSGGANHNNNQAQVASFKTEGGISEAQAKARLEIPRLKGGSNNMFIAHTVSGIVNYCIEYDCNKKASRWTAYQWYNGLSSNNKSWNRNSWYESEWRGDPFQPDPLIPESYRWSASAYSGSGYQRGHMLGSADRLNSKKLNEQTFYMSNMQPQSGAFNAGDGSVWYTLEGKLRNEYDKDSFRDTLYVVKGGTIDSNYTMKGNLLVPNYFFMAILCKNKDKSQGGYKAIGFWMPHTGDFYQNWKKYAVSIDALEEKTGIDFFCNLPDDIENLVERNLAINAWGK